MKFSLIGFDVDGTLAKSRQAIESPIKEQLCELLKKYKIVIISGGDYPLFKKNVLAPLISGSGDFISNLYLMPATGSQMYEFKNDDWSQVYEKKLPFEIIMKLEESFNSIIEEFPMYFESKPYGERFQNRGTQVSFSALGENAPLEIKSEWDKDQEKRKAIIESIKPSFQDLDFKIGGTSTIDITLPGIDKAYAIEKIAEHTKTPHEEILFVGDAIFPGGNDYAVTRLSITVEQVDNANGTNTFDTERLLASIIDESYQGK